MELNQKIRQLEDEIKLLKGEVKETLVDIREHFLNLQNPFTSFEFLPSEEEGVKVREEVELREEKPSARVEEADIDAEEERQSVNSQEEKPSARVEEEVEAMEKVNNDMSENLTSTEEIPRSPPTSPLSKPNVEEHRNGTMELGTLAGMMQWASKAAGRIGRKKVEAIVEVYQLTGHLSPEQKEVLLKVLNLTEGEKPEGPVSTRECIAVLVQLDALLGKGSTSEAALLSILFDDGREGAP